MSNYSEKLRRERREELAVQVQKEPSELEEFYNHNHGVSGRFSPGSSGGVSGEAKVPKEVSTRADRKAVIKKAGGIGTGITSKSRKQYKETRQAHKVAYKQGGTYKEVTSRLGLIKVKKLDKADLKTIPTPQLSALHKVMRNNIVGAAFEANTSIPGSDAYFYGKWRFNRLTPQNKRIQSELKSRNVKLSIEDCSEFDSLLNTEFVSETDSIPSLTAEEKIAAIEFLKDHLADVDEDPDAPSGFAEELKKLLTNEGVTMSDYADKLRRERREELSLRVSMIEEASGIYTYEVEVEETDFGFLPPFIKANMIKGLEKKLAAETDDDKKAEIQAKIDKLKGGKKELSCEITVGDLDFGSLPPFLKAGMIKGLEKKLAAETDDDKKAEIQAKIDKLKGDTKEELAYILDDGEEVMLVVNPSPHGTKELSEVVTKAELASRVDLIISEGEEVELGIVNWFKEKLHPRGKDGKFSKGDSGLGKGGLLPTMKQLRNINKKGEENEKKALDAEKKVEESDKKAEKKKIEEAKKAQASAVKKGLVPRGGHDPDERIPPEKPGLKMTTEEQNKQDMLNERKRLMQEVIKGDRVLNDLDMYRDKLNKEAKTDPKLDPKKANEEYDKLTRLLNKANDEHVKDWPYKDKTLENKRKKAIADATKNRDNASNVRVSAARSMERKLQDVSKRRYDAVNKQEQDKRIRDFYDEAIKQGRTVTKTSVNYPPKPKINTYPKKPSLS